MGAKGNMKSAGQRPAVREAGGVVGRLIGEGEQETHGEKVLER